MKSEKKAQHFCQRGHCHTCHWRGNLGTIQLPVWQKRISCEYESGLIIEPSYITLTPEGLPIQASLDAMLRRWPPEHWLGTSTWIPAENGMKGKDEMDQGKCSPRERTYYDEVPDYTRPIPNTTPQLPKRLSRPCVRKCRISLAAWFARPHRNGIRSAFEPCWRPRLKGSGKAPWQPAWRSNYLRFFTVILTASFWETISQKFG